MAAVKTAEQRVERGERGRRRGEEEERRRGGEEENEAKSSALCLPDCESATARKGGRGRKGSKGSQSRREGGAGRSKNRIPDTMKAEI